MDILKILFDVVCILGIIFLFSIALFFTLSGKFDASFVVFIFLMVVVFLYYDINEIYFSKEVY